MAGYVPSVDAFGLLSGLGDTLRQGRDDAAANDVAARLPAWLRTPAPAAAQNPFAFAVTPAGQGAAAGPTFPSTPTAPGGPTPQQAYAYGKFLEAGHTPQSAAAMVANLSGESGRTLRADAMNNSGTETGGHINARGAYGIAQWNGDRQFGLLQYARATGDDPRSLDTQIGFVDHELKTQHPDLYAASRDPNASAGGLLQRYVADYERPADVAGGVRQRSQYLGLNYGGAPAARGVQLAGPIPTPDSAPAKASTPGFQAIAPQGAPSDDDVANAKAILADPVSPTNMRAYAQDVIQRAGTGAQAAPAPQASPVDPEQARWQARTSPPAGPAIPDAGAPMPPARPADIDGRDTAAGTPTNAPGAPMPPLRQPLPKRSDMRPAGLLAAGQTVPDGAGGYVPASNSRYDPATGNFLPGGAQGQVAPSSVPPPEAIASVAQRASAAGFDPIRAISQFFGLPGQVATQLFAGVTGQSPAQAAPQGGIGAPTGATGLPQQPLAQGGQQSAGYLQPGAAGAQPYAPSMADAAALARSSNPGLRAIGTALASKIVGQSFESPLATLATPEQKAAVGLPANLPGVWQFDLRTHALSKVADDPASQRVLTVETPEEKRAAGLPADLPGTWQVNPRTGAAAQLYDKGAKNAATRVQVVGEDEFGHKRYGIPMPDGSIKPVDAGAAPGAGASSASAPQATGDAYIATLPPDRQSQVRAIVEGRAPLPPPTNPFNRETRAHVMNADPSFDAGNAQARVQMRKQFADTTNAKPGGQIAALNTLAQHLDTLSDQAEGLNNYHSGMAYGVVPSGWANEANTWRRGQMNDPRIAQFNATRQLVTDELFKLVKGGQISEGETSRFEKSLNAANSPEQLRATLSEISVLARGRLEALNTQWRGTMGEAASPAALNDAGTARILDKVFARGHGGADAGAQQPGAPIAPRGSPVPSSAGTLRAPAGAQPGGPAGAGANAPVANIAQPGEAFGAFVQRGGSPPMDMVRVLRSDPSSKRRAQFDRVYGAGAADAVIGPADFGRQGAGIGP